MASIATISPTPVISGVPVTLPVSQAIPKNVDNMTFSSPVSLADKLAIGKTLDLSVEVSMDGGTTWEFVASMTWTSYGPAGIVLMPACDLTLEVTSPPNLVNPDPALSLPMAKYAGGLARVKLTPTGLSQVALSVADA